MAAPEVREAFEKFRDSDIAAYEGKLARLREGLDRTIERKRVAYDHLESVARDQGLELSRFHERHESEAEWVEGHLQEIRPPLMNRPSPAETDLLLRANYHGILEEAGGHNAELLGVVQLAPDVADFDGIEGERGNPWLLPKNTDYIHVGGVSKGSGCGCFSGYTFWPSMVLAYFSYLPPKSTVVTFQAWIALHGFYIAKAYDTALTCKFAKVYADVEMRAAQYLSASDAKAQTAQPPNYLAWPEGNKSIWCGSADHPIVSIDDDNVDTQEIVDETFQLTMTAPVKAGFPVVIRVGMWCGVCAVGGGSYAEVNFNSKAPNGDELNYMYVPCVVVYE